MASMGQSPQAMRYPSRDDLDDAEWEAEMTPFANAIRAALAEGGYPDAEVTIGWSGVFVEGAPQAVINKAAEVCRGIA